MVGGWQEKFVHVSQPQSWILHIHIHNLPTDCRGERVQQVPAVHHVQGKQDEYGGAEEQELFVNCGNHEHLTQLQGAQLWS